MPPKLWVSGFEGSLKAQQNNKGPPLHLLLMLPKSYTGQKELEAPLIIAMLLSIRNIEPLSSSLEASAVMSK